MQLNVLEGAKDIDMSYMWKIQDCRKIKQLVCVVVTLSLVSACDFMFSLGLKCVLAFVLSRCLTLR